MHITSAYKENGINPIQRSSSAFRHMQKNHPDADLLVITGDLAHAGEVEAYEILKSQLSALHIPTQLMIGNHDVRENFISVFPDTKTDGQGFVQSVMDWPGHRLIFLDTLNAPPYDYPMFHSGMLCAHRLEWLRSQLATAGDRSCILFMHHPPHDTGFEIMDKIKLQNGPEFYDLIGQFANVKHIFCGHVHRTISGSHNGVPFSVFKSTVGQTPMLLDLTDGHMEVPEPAAYGILLLHDDGILVHTDDYELTDLDDVRRRQVPTVIDEHPPES
jgi:3',5'-cyclic AMP phosphodiesterase CpdA